MNLNLTTKIHGLVDAQLDEIATDKVLKIPLQWNCVHKNVQGNYPITKDSERRSSVQRSRILAHYLSF